MRFDLPISKFVPRLAEPEPAINIFPTKSFVEKGVDHPHSELQCVDTYIYFAFSKEHKNASFHKGACKYRVNFPLLFSPFKTKLKRPSKILPSLFLLNGIL